MRKPCRIQLLIIALATLATSFAHAAEQYAYDASMSFLKAGELKLNMNRIGDDYEVAGQFETSRAMSRYYSWNGVFAAVGKWEGRGPVTTAYMSRTVSKDDDLKIVLNYEDGARVLDGPEGEFETVDKPGGVDLISALFFSPTCYQGGQVHDGEDTYQLRLRAQREHDYRAGDAYYSGPVLSCDYSVIDYKNRKRRVIVSLAQIAGMTVAVQLRAKIPILPDALFKLRKPQPSNQLAALK